MLALVLITLTVNAQAPGQTDPTCQERWWLDERMPSPDGRRSALIHYFDTEGPEILFCENGQVFLTLDAAQLLERPIHCEDCGWGWGRWTPNGDFELTTLHGRALHVEMEPPFRIRPTYPIPTREPLGTPLRLTSSPYITRDMVGEAAQVGLPLGIAAGFWLLGLVWRRRSPVR